MNLKKKDNIYKILDILSKGYFSTSELAFKLGVSQRSIQRYLKHIKNTGYKLVKKGRKYTLEEKVIILSEFVITDKEIKILKNIIQVLKKAGFPFLKDYEKIIEKIERIKKAEIELESVFPFVKPFEKNIFENICRGIAERRILKIIYRAPYYKKDKEISIIPLFVFMDTEGFYLLALTKDSEEYRTYKLSRIKDVYITKESMSLKYISMIKDRNEIIKDMWGPWKGERSERVKLKLKRYAKAVFEELNYPDMKIIEKKRNYVIIEIEISDLKGFLRSILKFVDDAEVLGPKRAVRIIKGFLNKMNNIYK